MKKFLTTFAAVLCCSISTWAQSPYARTKMSAWLQQKYQQHQAEVKQNGGQLRAKGKPVRKYIMTLVKSTDQDKSIRQKGGFVCQDFGKGFSAAFLPIDSLDVLCQCPSILGLEANEPAKLMNDTSAIITGVDKVWNFEKTLNSQPSTVNSSSPQAFTGKGVIAGVMDVGFDFTHPAFRNDDGTSRIKWFWDPMTPDANDKSFGMIFSTPGEVLAAQHCTNANEDDHGTHVLGSMAGRGLRGRYVGMAPEADIIGVYEPLGYLTDEFNSALHDYIATNIQDFPGLDECILKVNLSDIIDLVGLYKIFEQADAAGQPCVVNWSFGSANDLTNDFTMYEQVLNQMVGPGRIVVVAAGNSGEAMTYQKKQADTPLNQVFYFYGKKPSVLLKLCAQKDDLDFKIGLQLTDVPDTFFINMSDVVANTNAGMYYVDENDAAILYARTYPSAYGKTAFSVELKLKDDYQQSCINEYEYIVVSGHVIIDTPVDVDLQGYYNATGCLIFNLDDQFTSRGCHQGTLCFPGCIERVITVGAMQHRSTFTNVLGEVNNTAQKMGSKDGQLVAFSSCGPTMNGHIKPDVVTPGVNIISALNSYYRVNNDLGKTYDTIGPNAAYYTNMYGNNYFMVAKNGTSMAAPITAGIIALWLQAKPDLTPEDIKGVLQRTCHQPEPDFSGTDKNIYYGWGEIDAYAGLLDILGLETSIPTLSKHQPAGISFRLVDRTLYIQGIDSEKVTVYDLNGRPVLQTVTDGTLQLSSLPAGVYAVQIGVMGSTLIRLP